VIERRAVRDNYSFHITGVLRFVLLTVESRAAVSDIADAVMKGYKERCGSLLARKAIERTQIAEQPRSLGLLPMTWKPQTC